MLFLLIFTDKNILKKELCGTVSTQKTGHQVYLFIDPLRELPIEFIYLLTQL